MKKAIGFMLVLMTLAASGYSQGNDASDLIGKWVFSGGSVEFTGEQTGKMVLENRNPNAPCPDGSITRFKWSVSGSKLKLNYTSMHICGEKQPTPESDTPQSFTVQGNTLKWANISWEKKY